RDNERSRKEKHELPNDPGPEEQRHKRSQRHDRTRKNRPEYFPCSAFSCLLDGNFSIIENTVGVLHYHNRVVHHNTQGKQERKQYDHIQRKADRQDRIQRRHDQKGQEGRKRYGQGHKDRVGCPHEEHEDHRHQHKTNDNGIDQIVQGNPGGVRLVSRDGGFQAGRKIIRHHVVHDRVDLVGGVDQVFPASLDHVQGNYVFPVQAGVTLLLFVSIHHFGNVPQIHLGAAGGGDQNILHLLCIAVFPVHTQGALHAVNRHQTSRYGHVFRCDGLLDIRKGNIGSLHLIKVHV